MSKKTPEGVYAGCVGVRKNYGYVGWQWKEKIVCVVVQFYPWFKFYFPLFKGMASMVMSLKTKGNEI